MFSKSYHFFKLKKIVFVLSLFMPIGIIHATTANNNTIYSKTYLVKSIKRNLLMNKKGMQVYQSPYSVTETINKIEKILQEKGIIVFSKIKFSEDAKKAGLIMPDEEMIVFGDPKAGTLLMQEDPTIAFELPLKILAWRTDDTTHVGFIVPSVMAKEYAINKSQAIIQKMDVLLQNLIKNAIKGTVS